MTEQRIAEAQARLDTIPATPLFAVRRDDDSCMTQVLVATTPTLADADCSEGFVGGNGADSRIIAGLLVQRPLKIASDGEGWDQYAAFFAAAPADLRLALAALRRVLDWAEKNGSEMSGHVLDDLYVAIHDGENYRISETAHDDSMAEMGFVPARKAVDDPRFPKFIRSAVERASYEGFRDFYLRPPTGYLARTLTVAAGRPPFMRAVDITVDDPAGAVVDAVRFCVLSIPVVGQDARSVDVESEANGVPKTPSPQSAEIPA